MLNTRSRSWKVMTLDMRILYCVEFPMYIIDEKGTAFLRSSFAMDLMVGEP
jgi:hypothetical protein